MKTKTEANVPYLSTGFKHPSDLFQRKSRSVAKLHKKQKKLHIEETKLNSSKVSETKRIEADDDLIDQLNRLNLDKKQDNISPILEDSKEEVKTPSKFKSRKDEKFVMEMAPKIMKKLLINQSGWRTFEDSSTKQFLKKYEESYKVDEDEVQRKYDKLMKDKSFAISFVTDFDQEWLKRCLARPISKSECPGYIYVYYVKENEAKKKENKVIPFKIGRAVNCPKRIGHCEKENGESYNVAIIEATQYYKHFEAIVHDYFKEERIIRDEIKDGKTEWFYKKFSDIEKVIKMSKIYLKEVHKDKGDR